MPGTMIGSAKKLLRSATSPLLDAAEARQLARYQSEAEHAPLFIVGAPRTGSTLLYKLMTIRFQVCYLSNLMMRFADTPLAVAALSRRFGGCNPVDNYRSHYGEYAAWRDPAQAWRFWNLYLPGDPDHLLPDDVAPETRTRIRQTIGRLQQMYDCPFINKWQKNSARMPLLADLFPNVFFVNITRDPVSTAHSILKGRRNMLGDEQGWLSVKPRNYQAISSKPPAEQVCEQVFYMEKDIAEYTAGLPSGAVYSLSYEALCRDPRRCLDDIADAYLAHTGARLASRRAVPISFPVSEIREPTPEQERLAQHWRQLAGRDDQDVKQKA